MTSRRARVRRPLISTDGYIFIDRTNLHVGGARVRRRGNEIKNEGWRASPALNSVDANLFPDLPSAHLEGQTQVETHALIQRETGLALSRFS
jgi:hypothetical protein